MFAPTIIKVDFPIKQNIRAWFSEQSNAKVEKEGLLVLRNSLTPTHFRDLFKTTLDKRSVWLHRLSGLANNFVISK